MTWNWFMRLFGVRIIEGISGARVTLPKWWPESMAEAFIEAARAKVVSGKDAHLIEARVYGRTLVVKYREGAGPANCGCVVLDGERRDTVDCPVHGHGTEHWRRGHTGVPEK